MYKICFMNTLCILYFSPKKVIIEDKHAQEQLRLISELDKDDKTIIFKMIDKTLTSQKFKEFFKKNLASI